MTKAADESTWMCSREGAPAPKVGDLLPCPFCGGEAVAQWWHNARLGTFIDCDNDWCRVNPSACERRPDLAAKEWNQRA